MLKVITSPGQEPITLTEARDHLNIPTSDTGDDTYITTLITVAREEVEARTHRQIMPVTLEYQMDKFEESRLPNPPFQVLDSVKYDDKDGNEQTLATTKYWIDETSEPARFIRADGVTWPETQVRKPNAVRIRYSAGYGLEFTSSGNTITATNHNYNDGQKVRVFTSNSDLPSGLSVSTDYYVISTSGNTFELSATYGGSAITLADAGTGTHWVTHIPEQLKQAMLIIMTDYKEQGQASWVTGHVVSPIPMVLERLTNPYKVWSGP